MTGKEFSKETQLLANMFDYAMKLRFENAHMLGILKRMGITPNFPEYGAKTRKREDMPGSEAP